MPGRQDHEGANKAAALLATSFVVVGGAVTCTFVATAMHADWKEALAIGGVTFGSFALLLWLLRDRTPQNTARLRWGWLGRKPGRKVALKLKRARAAERYEAPPAPPTAASVRDLKGGINTWVPSAASQKPSPKRPQPGQHT